VYLKQASLQIYTKKTFWWQKKTGSKDSPVYQSQGSLISLMYFASAAFFVNQHTVGQLPGVFITGEYSGESIINMYQ
jgi:hypothetical protein